MLSHSCLFYKLMKKQVPYCFVNILCNWYNKLYSKVRWGNFVSDIFKITCGIRQGGALSPTLFATCVDDILCKLSKHGCCINGLPYGAFMYADDLILLTPTLTELQTTVNICQDELDAINLKINV